MAKLNKSQILSQVTEIVQSFINDNVASFKANKAEDFETSLLKAMRELLAPKKRGGAVSNKMKDGLVYCNYFKDYFSPESFKTRTNGKPKANCIEAEKILRKLKNLKITVEKKATNDLRAKRITRDDWFDIMNKLDTFTARKFESVEQIVWDVEIAGPSY